MPAKRARSKKAWSGRMAEATHPLVEAFTTSYPIDCRLYPYDIAGSIAHCRMLAKQRIIPVLLLTAVALRLDDDDAFGGDPPVFQLQKALPAGFGKRGAPDIEAQMNGGFDLVDMLSSRALGTHGVQLDLAVGYLYGRGDGEHEVTLLPVISPSAVRAPRASF